jgi:hypothetical protein
MQLSRQVISATVLLVAIYLIVRNAKGAASVLQASGGAYAKGVKTLQGR